MKSLLGFLALVFFPVLSQSYSDFPRYISPMVHRKLGTAGGRSASVIDHLNLTPVLHRNLGTAGRRSASVIDHLNLTPVVHRNLGSAGRRSASVIDHLNLSPVVHRNLGTAGRRSASVIDHRNLQIGFIFNDPSPQIVDNDGSILKQVIGGDDSQYPITVSSLVFGNENSDSDTFYVVTGTNAPSDLQISNDGVFEQGGLCLGFCSNFKDEIDKSGGIFIDYDDLENGLIKDTWGYKIFDGAARQFNGNGTLSVLGCDDTFHNEEIHLELPTIANIFLDGTFVTEELQRLSLVAILKANLNNLLSYLLVTTTFTNNANLSKSLAALQFVIYTNQINLDFLLTSLQNLFDKSLQNQLEIVLQILANSVPTNLVVEINYIIEALKNPNTLNRIFPNSIDLPLITGGIQKSWVTSVTKIPLPIVTAKDYLTSVLYPLLHQAFSLPNRLTAKYAICCFITNVQLDLLPINTVSMIKDLATLILAYLPDTTLDVIVRTFAGIQNTDVYETLKIILNLLQASDVPKIIIIYVNSILPDVDNVVPVTTPTVPPTVPYTTRRTTKTTTTTPTVTNTTPKPQTNSWDTFPTDNGKAAPSPEDLQYPYKLVPQCTENSETCSLLTKLRVILQSSDIVEYIYHLNLDISDFPNKGVLLQYILQQLATDHKFSADLLLFIKDYLAFLSKQGGITSIHTKLNITVSDADFDNPAVLLPPCLGDSQLCDSIYDIRRLLENSNVIQYVLRFVNNRKLYSTKAELLQIILQNLISSNSISNNDMKLIIEYYSHLLQNYPNANTLASIFGSLVVPKNSQEEKMYELLIQWLSKQETIITVLNSGFHGNSYKTAGELLRNFLIFSLNHVSQLQQDTQLYNAIMYFVNEIRTDEVVIGKLDWSLVLERYGIKTELHTVTINLTHLLRAIDFNKLSDDEEDQVYSLFSTKYVLSSLTEFQGFQYETKGKFLRAFVQYMLKKSTLSSSSRNILQKILPLISLTGTGSQSLF